MEQELNQTGDAQEQPKEDTSKATPVATSTEEKATSEKTRTEKEFTSMQSMKDKADARATKAEALVGSVQNELQEFRTDIERQKQEGQQKEIDSLAGDPDAQSRLRKIYQREDNARKAEADLKKKDEGLTGKWNHAIDLAKEYNLYDAIEDLLAAENPKEMELLAKVKAMEKEKIPTPTKETKESDFTPDSGTSDAGADSDKTFQEKWNSGELPATKENIARAQKIIK